MREYKVLVMWEGDDSEREFMGLAWANGESKSVVDLDIESSVHSEDFMGDEIMSIDTGNWKFCNRRGRFTVGDMSIFFHVERKDEDGYGIENPHQGFISLEEDDEVWGGEDKQKFLGWHYANL